MAQPIQHHTVPAAYLAGFLEHEETLLRVYARDGRHFRGKPDSLCSRRHYHSIDKDGIKDNTVEEFLANDVEGPGILALRKLVDCGELSQFERAHLCVYMAIQILRTPHMRENFEGAFRVILDGFTRRRLRDIEGLADFLAVRENLTRQEAEQRAKRARAAYMAGRISLEVKSEYSLAKIFDHYSIYAEAMADWDWEVVKSPVTDFITCDCPVHFADKKHIALMDPETALHFPLTSNALLIMRFRESEDRLWEELSCVVPQRYLPGFRVWHNHVGHREASIQEVEDLNRITASMASTFIFCGYETDAFGSILSKASENVAMRVTSSGDELRLDLI